MGQNFVPISDAFALREFLNGHTAKDLRVINLENKATGDAIKGLHIRVEVLSDGSEVVDYVFA